MTSEGQIPSNVSRETTARLKHYLWLLQKWNPTINLVAKSTLAEAWNRHFMDSDQIFSSISDVATHWVDLGSGGGFPGLVVAIIGAEKAPDMSVTLVESDQRKAVFLRTVARETGVTVKVLAQRAEDIAPLAANVVSARALAPLKSLLEYTSRHIAQDGVAIFPKGENYRQEITDALASWRFDLQLSPSRTESRAVILTIRGLQHV